MTNYPSEKIARRDIVEAGRRLYEKNLVCANDGNISARISAHEIIATPTGVSKGFMTEDMLIKLDTGGNVLSGLLNPSSEIKMHLAVYNASPEIMAVCHAHPPAASAFAAAGVPLDKPVLQESVLLLGDIPVAAYAPPGSQELAHSVAALCRDFGGALLEHHGAVSFGRSITDSLFKMERIEYMAMVIMYSKLMGFTRTLDEAQVQTLEVLKRELNRDTETDGT